MVINEGVLICYRRVSALLDHCAVNFGSTGLDATLSNQCSVALEVKRHEPWSGRADLRKHAALRNLLPFPDDGLPGLLPTSCQ